MVIRNFFRTACAAGLALLFAATLTADEIKLKNGDRFSGKFAQADDNEVTFVTALAGPVKLKWDDITDVDTNGLVALNLADGQKILGMARTVGDSFEVLTSDAGLVNVPRSSVKSIRGIEQQAIVDAEAERLRNPRLTDLWIGLLDFGFARASGNADTQTLTVGANANRVTNRDKIQVRFTSIYASNDVTGDSVVTANAIRGGVGYNLDITRKWFGWTSVDLEFDEFQSLDLRFVPAGGAGYHLFKNDRGFLDLLGGMSMNREFFSNDIDRTSAEAPFGNDFAYKLNTRMAVTENFRFFPNLSESGEYRINFDAALVTNLWKWLSWQVSASDRYLSNPVEGRKNNDLLFTTGVRLTFAKADEAALIGGGYGVLVPVYPGERARVYANDRLVGYSSSDAASIGLSLPPGSYRVRIVPASGGQPVEQDVTISSGVKATIGK